MRTNPVTESIAELAAVLATTGLVTPFRAARMALECHAIARRAHRLFERACNVPMADGSYERALYRLTGEMKAALHGVVQMRDTGPTNEPRWEWQTDPRGWPIIITIDRQQYRVGGRP